MEGRPVSLKTGKMMLGIAMILTWINGGNAFASEEKKDEIKPVVTVLENKMDQVNYQVPEYWDQRERKVVYLTFDDGPSARTRDILEVLKEHDVPATFFFIGTQISGREEIIKEVDQAGHYVGMHSISHSVDTLYNAETPDNLSNELIEMQDMMEEIIGKRPILFRPPYGSMPHMNKEPIIESLVKNGFKCWDWTVDTLDWNATSAAQIINTVERTSGDKNEIVLLHEKALSVEALPGIIKHYKEKGYEFRVYDESMHLVKNFMKDERL